MLITLCQILCLKVAALTSRSRNLASGMCTNLHCVMQILLLIVVVLTSSSRNLASLMGTDLIVSDTGPQGSSSDL